MPKGHSAFTISYDKIDFLNRHKTEFRLEHLFEGEHHDCLLSPLRGFADDLLRDLRADAHS